MFSYDFLDDRKKKLVEKAKKRHGEDLVLCAKTGGKVEDSFTEFNGIMYFWYGVNSFESNPTTAVAKEE